MLEGLHKPIKGYEDRYLLHQSGKVYSFKSKRYLATCKSKKDTCFYVHLYGGTKPHKKLYISEKLLKQYFGEEAIW